MLISRQPDSGGEHAMVAREVSPRFWHHGGQVGDEVQGFQYDVGGAVAIWGLSWFPNTSSGVLQNQITVDRYT